MKNKVKALFFAFLSIFIIGISFLFYRMKKGDMEKNPPAKVDTEEGCDVVMVSGGNLYLGEGSIFAFKNDKKKRYYIVKGKSIDMPRASFANAICFKSESEAEASGLTKVELKN